MASPVPEATAPMVESVTVEIKNENDANDARDITVYRVATRIFTRVASWLNVTASGVTIGCQPNAIAPDIRPKTETARHATTIRLVPTIALLASKRLLEMGFDSNARRVPQDASAVMASPAKSDAATTSKNGAVASSAASGISRPDLVATNRKSLAMED